MARLRASWRTSLPVVQQPRNPQSESIARSPYEVRWNACAPVIRPAVGPNRTASYLPATLAVMRHSGDQMRLVNLLGGSLDRRVDRGKVRHIPRGLSGLPEFAPLPGKSGEGMMRR